MDLFPVKLTGGSGSSTTVLFILNVLLVSAYVFIVAYAATKGYKAA